MFIEHLNCLEGIKIVRTGKIEELKQQDYRGKRVHIIISDYEGNQVRSKIDLGVHVRFEIEQEEYCFDVAMNDEGASLLINSDEQMFAEKLSSLLKFGPLSTRFKDIYDLSYLSNIVNKDKLQVCLEAYIYNNSKMKEKNIASIVRRLQMTFGNAIYRSALETSNMNWLEKSTEKVLDELLKFIETLKESLCA